MVYRLRNCPAFMVRLWTFGRRVFNLTGKTLPSASASGRRPRAAGNCRINHTMNGALKDPYFLLSRKM